MKLILQDLVRKKVKIYEGAEKQAYCISSHSLPVIPLPFPDFNLVESQLPCMPDSIWEMRKPHCALTHFPVSVDGVEEDAGI